MKNYKYFKDVESNAYFTDIPCQFCGSKELCLDGVFFERDDMVSICLTCFDKKKVRVEVPVYIKEKVKEDADNKFKTLQLNPPVPWIQSNDWPVCCDDYMIYIGEWTRDDFNAHTKMGNGKELFKRLLEDETAKRVENFDFLWEAIGDEIVAFVFKCLHCEKIVVVCQDY